MLDAPAGRLRAERPDHVWALDYQFDVTSTGRILNSSVCPMSSCSASKTAARKVPAQVSFRGARQVEGLANLMERPSEHDTLSSGYGPVWAMSCTLEPVSNLGRKSSVCVVGADAVDSWRGQGPEFVW